MDGRPTTAESKHHYQSSPWPTAPSSSGTPQADSTPHLEASPAQFATHLELLPILFPQQSSFHHARLLHYNGLIWPGRGGGAPQAQPPAPALSSPRSQAVARSRSSSKVSNKDNSQSRPGTQNCHGNRSAANCDTADRALIAQGKEMASKMSGKKRADAPSASNSSNPPKPHHALPARPAAQSAPGVAGTSAQSSSVPSTPHQYAREFAFESREPSPGAPQNHSPRSAYSETNSTLPSLRPLPPRLGGCRFETAPAYSRRRMNYSLGSDRLEAVDMDKVKSKLSEDEKRTLTTDMRELYNRLLPTKDIEKNRQKLVHKLEKLLNDEWPGHDIRVHLFGSSGNLLCSDDSDVDICITTEWKELEGVCMIAELLSKHGMEKVVCVSSAKVPIVKIWDPELGLACDMNVNNTLALENTRMVRTYVEIDERVRPLAMIIKYWTRKRIVNDAAFGGTLSSYTWICMIIAFLQLRDPPLLPALHQQRHRLINKDGCKSAFADDMDKLKGAGRKNRDTLGDLLFQFFRFYAHEFDYDKYALSVRLGKLITKTEKKWHLALNNCLCVEEPFNTIRNLGNTADDTSFRGLHLELRRAFDFIAEGKLDECCEQYVFPKEEERIWQKPAPAPRPILVRSSSQQHSNRGGRGGFRGGSRQFHRGGNNNRRASSSVTYDANAAAFVQPGVQAPMTTQEAHILWYQAQQQALHHDIFGTALNALQAQESNLRFHLYTQQQAMQQHQVLTHAQRMQGGSSQSTDRSRTNSFDNPPLTAPLRPDLSYIYPYSVQPSPYFVHPGFTTYPSSPSTATSGTVPEFRRSLHRSNGTAESGTSTGSGTLRSQSQPASRSSMPTQTVPGYPASAQPPAGVPVFPSRHINGVPIPSFIPDEANDPEFDDSPPKTISDSPPEDEGPRYVGYYVNETSHSPGQRPPNGIPMAIPTFGDLGQNSQGRRRLSTDQLPQSILDRRMRRTSRSPSPLGHARAFSVGTSSAPLTSVPFPSSGSKLGPSRGPLVVNGTGMGTGAKFGAPLGPGANRQPSTGDGTGSEDSGYDNPLRINQQGRLPSSSWTEPALGQPLARSEPSPALKDRPVVVNGSTSTHPPTGPQFFSDAQLFSHRLAAMNGLNLPYYQPVTPEAMNDLSRLSPGGRARTISRQQQSGIAPLDLATGEFTLGQEFQNLSPVYENRTSPSALMRKPEFPSPSRMDKSSATTKPSLSKDPRLDLPSRPAQKTPPTKKTPPTSVPITKQELVASPSTANPRVNGISREPGHVRGAKSESENLGAWQKPKARKKGIADLKSAANGFAHSEQLPKNDAERKGG